MQPGLHKNNEANNPILSKIKQFKIQKNANINDEEEDEEKKEDDEEDAFETTKKNVNASFLINNIKLQQQPTILKREKQNELGNPIKKIQFSGNDKVHIFDKQK